MAACRIVYQPVSQAVSSINTAKGAYDTAAETFVKAFTTAIADMEGAAKDALLDFFTKNVQPFVSESLPGAVEGMAKLLEANLTNFTDVDQQIANSISGG